MATLTAPATALVKTTIPVAGTGFTKRGKLQLLANGNVVASFRAKGNGSFEVGVVSGAVAGPLRIDARYVGKSEIVATATVTVQVAPGPEPTPTGANLADYANFAAAYEASKTKNKTLIVPAGRRPGPQTYLQPYAGFRLLGEDREAAILYRPQVGVHAGPGWFQPLVADVEIGGLTLEGTGKRLAVTGQTGRGDDILLNPINAPRLNVHDIGFLRAQGCAFQSEGDLTSGQMVRFWMRDTYTRDNGFHGVALWLYHGTKDMLFDQFEIDGADYAGIFFDAGTVGDTGASSVNGNILKNYTIRNAARGQIGGWGSYPVGRGASVMLTGAKANRGEDGLVTDALYGPAFAFGVDQSGLPATDNVFIRTQTARIASGRLMDVAPGCVGNSVTA